MTPEQRASKNERFRERYATDPEFRERELARCRAWSLANRPKRAARKARWRAANRDRALAQERRSSSIRRLRPEVREDARRRTRAWHDADPDRRRVIVLRRHGLTIAEYEALLAAQGGGCAVCGRPEKATLNGRRRRLAVDHDHKTGRIRGLLCGNCNSGIGHFGDDPDRLLSAVAYLSASKEAAA